MTREYMCPHCGWKYDAAGMSTCLVPSHEWAAEPCPGVGQGRRNPESDRRPLWKDLPRRSTVYTVYPVKGAELRPDTSLLVVDLFHPAVRLVMLRYPGAYEYTGYVEGDGALALREIGVCLLRLRKVSEISGCAQAIEESRR